MNAVDEQARARRVELILQQIEALPTLSPIASRLLDLGGPSEADLSEIAKVIESDPSMTARMLGLCRRAHLGLGNRITSVKQAVVLLGLDAVQAAVLSVSVYEVMDGARRRAAELDDDGPGAAFDRVGFWTHSVGVACASELIARAHPKLGVGADEAFVSGLLHNLGKLALEVLLPKAYGRVIALSEERQSASAPVERSVLGLDHHTAAKRLAEHWSLPHALQDVMWLHGQPLDALPEVAHRQLIAVVTCARALCRHLHLGWSGEFDLLPPMETVCEQSGLDWPAIRADVPRLHEGVADRCAILGLGNESTPDLLLRSLWNANAKLAKLTSAMDRRARESQGAARVVSSIAAFHADSDAPRDVAGALSRVARSAAELLAGDGIIAVLLQARPTEPWQLSEFDRHGERTRFEVIDPPGGLSAARAGLASLGAPGELSVLSAGLVPWITDYLSTAADIRNVRLVRLGEIRVDEGAACLLICEGDLDASLGSKGRKAVAGMWGAAVSAAVHHEGARRLGEKLADAGRILTEARSRLAHADAMARVGAFAAGAAHEMNNPLTTISGRAQLLTQRLKDPADQAAARSIADAAGDLSELIAGLNAICSPPAPRLEEASAADIARQAISRAEGRTGHSGRVRLTGEPGPAAVVDRELIAHALSELLANALEADGSSAVELRIQFDPANDRLSFLVKDQGPGLSPRALHHAFDPFFSEKPAGRRPGLGLAKARRLAELHGGQVTLASTQGQGAVAHLWIPRRFASAPRAAA